ncbi:glycoside hydrolase family 26 protein [Parafrankia discariae]|uniref:glycoside hydrolase family 26 protein n=1 Tax=Parafrankia discariae TaxID=365528 RepID=UPI0003795E69|nr:glycosyl hydrolase [Parafrankia discariae]
MASTPGGRPTPQVDRISRFGFGRNPAGAPASRPPRPRRRHRFGRGPRLGLAAGFVLALSLPLVAPAGAAPPAATPTSSPTVGTAPEADGTSSPAPSSSAGDVADQQVPVAGLTTGPATAGQSKLTLVLFDSDIVLVGGRGFGAGKDVAVTAATSDLGGSATARAGADGRFILGFQVPLGFTGRVTVTAKQESVEASGTLDVVDAGTPGLASRAAGDAEVPAPTPTATPVPAPAATPAPTTSAPTTSEPTVSGPTSSEPTGTAPATTPSTAPSTAPGTGRRTSPAPTAVPAPTAAPSAGSGTGAGTGTGTTTGGNGRLSGLPWMSGVYPSHVLSQVLAFGTWRGRPNDVAHVFTIRTQGWNAMVEPRWPLDLYKAFPGKLIISQPTYPKGQGNNAACAQGAYDSYWKTFGTFLKNNGRADSIVRIGWEFNGTFMYWHADAAGTQFRDCFRKISTAIRSTDPEVKIDWTFNAHASPVPNGGTPWAAYPGDEYVDYVGIDSYDWYPPSRDEATWKKQCDDPNGLCYLLEFARQHGKKVGVGEWGVSSCSRNGGGDNPFYIQKMFDTFTQYADVMAYESYFHDAAPGNVCSTIMNGGQNPKASALYKKLFGSV